jgi:hypothetical protein
VCVCVCVCVCACVRGACARAAAAAAEHKLCCAYVAHQLLWSIGRPLTTENMATSGADICLLRSGDLTFVPFSLRVTTYGIHMKFGLESISEDTSSHVVEATLRRKAPLDNWCDDCGSHRHVGNIMRSNSPVMTRAP